MRDAERLAALRTRLERGPALLLDGAIGTELERRGVRCSLPLWSTHALLERPQVLAEIHRDYAAAGAEILTANTFRTQRRVLDRSGRHAAARSLTEQAVELARSAAQAAPRPVWVAGSAPPLEDCFRPDLVPASAELQAEHAEHLEHLAAAGVDLLLLETMNTVREAVAALEAARAHAQPAIVSFICAPGPRLLSGEPLADALCAVLKLAPAAVAVNCVSCELAAQCAPMLRGSGLPFGLYPNMGEPDGGGGFVRRTTHTPDEFAAALAACGAIGARLLGGCCGTTPAEIAALARALRPVSGRPGGAAAR